MEQKIPHDLTERFPVPHNEEDGEESKEEPKASEKHVLKVKSR